MRMVSKQSVKVETYDAASIPMVGCTHTICMILTSSLNVWRHLGEDDPRGPRQLEKKLRAPPWWILNRGDVLYFLPHWCGRALRLTTRAPDVRDIGYQQSCCFTIIWKGMEASHLIQHSRFGWLVVTQLSRVFRNRTRASQAIINENERGLHVGCFWVSAGHLVSNNNFSLRLLVYNAGFSSLSHG